MQIRKVLTFLSVLIIAMLIVPTAFAQEAAQTVANTAEVGMRALGAGLAIGLAAIGGGIGMGNAVSGALTGMARNPNMSGKIFSQMILGMALIESQVIYALVIAFMIMP